MKFVKITTPGKTIIFNRRTIKTPAIIPAHPNQLIQIKNILFSLGILKYEILDEDPTQRKVISQPNIKTQINEMQDQKEELVDIDVDEFESIDDMLNLIDE